MFIDGKKLDLPASLAKRYASDLLLEEFYGELANSNVSKFIIGGFQQRLGALGVLLTDVKLYWINGRV
jgi:hypothetical protein